MCRSFECNIETEVKELPQFLSLFYIYSYERVRVKVFPCRPTQGSHAEGERELQEGQLYLGEALWWKTARKNVVA